jgi:hypothetical protein
VDCLPNMVEILQLLCLTVLLLVWAAVIFTAAILAAVLIYAGFHVIGNTMQLTV